MDHTRLRYRNLLILAVLLGIAGLLVEQAFRLADLPWSLTDRKGPGQITLFIIIIVPMLWFSQAIAGVNPLAFFTTYGNAWRRALRGFLFMLAVSVGTMLVGYLVLALLGELSWSEKGWQELSPKIALRTITALLVVLVLATTEELIFRGFVLRYLRSNARPAVTIAAVIVSAAIFSLSHIIALQSAAKTPEYAPLLFGLFLLGALLGTVYVATGSIACSIGVHAGLLGFKVFFRHTHLAEIKGDWLMGGSSDLRVGPLSWLVLALAVAVAVYFRGWLSRKFRVETATSPDAGDGLNFRLHEESAETAR